MTISLLVVEDEVLIAFTLEEALNDAGFACLVATNGQEALDHLNDGATRFKGVLCDIRLGKGPDGWDVANRARELVPDMPVIYISADSVADWPSKGVPNSLMIPKPYASVQIVTAISTMINAAGTAPSAIMATAAE